MLAVRFVTVRYSQSEAADPGWRNLFQRSRFELLRCFITESSTFVAEKNLKAKLKKKLKAKLKLAKLIVAC